MASAVTPATTYETVIGLEVHVQLKTASKLFCPDSTTFGQAPNVNTCTVCLGYPGALPVLNRQAVEYAIMLGLAIHCEIAEVSKFDRKHYFYPDLPKAYQISQFDMPLCQHGWMELNSGRRVRILRAHLEEDAGKLVHAGADGLSGSDYSLSDLNRAGTPLLEIVSEPDLRSGEEAREYLTQLRNIVRYLGVCDGNLEEGSMRCDANVSVRPLGEQALGVKAEIKNMNSARALQRAIEYEAQRQIELIESGGRVIQETRLWNEATGVTLSMRGKEGSADYRYFPEPDLRPLVVSREWVERLRAASPELPHHRFERLTGEFGLSAYDANLLVDVKELGDCFEAAAALTPRYKTLANWLIGDITAALKADRRSLADTRLTPQALAELADLLEENVISSAIAKKILPDVLNDGALPRVLVESRGLAQVSDTGALRDLVAAVIADNPQQVEQYRAGKDKLLGFFVGQAMKRSKGSANPELLAPIIQAMLAE
ncbi:MAG: Asp-tRNA(Asn)/Glu-tRNA(Gln) amidotransferase subunit GatB [Vampirovibrionales bacterium]|nr:Asp-tRNA(Asn)/Glu-tRNA(Gln) amidotransferase subunit GatB [Vampirovibrionales bacterium]